jgi:hypothetical protein
VFWRKFRLDWSYAVGELFIVTIGVLVALAIGAWNSERLDKAEEFEILSRFISEIEADLLEYESRLLSIDEKEESLLRVRSALAGNGPKDITQFLNDIIIGANYGWDQGTAQRATFTDILGSGRLGIISNSDVRTLIINYYQANASEHLRIDARETAYPHVSYQIAPRSGTSMQHGTVVELLVEPGLSDEFLNERVKAAQELSIKNHVIAEINLARFIRGVTIGLRIKARGLINRIKEYQAQIE